MDDYATNWNHLGLCQKCGAVITTWLTKKESDCDFEMFPEYEKHSSHTVDGDDCKYNQSILSKRAWQRTVDSIVFVLENNIEISIQYEDGEWEILKGWDMTSYLFTNAWDAMQDEFAEYEKNYLANHPIGPY